MKNYMIWLFWGVLLGIFVSCDRKEDLKPSGLDVERLRDSLDWEYPLVREYYEKYGVAVLRRFDEALDLKFDFHDKDSRKFWDGLILSRIVRDTEMDTVMDILENSILSCFKNEFEWNGKVYQAEFVKKYFPTKIVLVNNLVSEWGASKSFPTESVNAASESLQGTIHGAINDNGIVMSLNTKVMYSSLENFQRYRNDILYFLLAFIVNKYDLYDRVPERFYQFSEPYYGKEISDLLEESGHIVDEVTGDTIRSISKAEYVRNYGVISNSVYPVWGGSIATFREVADRERDFRLYLDQLITPEILEGETQPVWNMTAVTRQKMWYLGHTLLDLGIDVSVLNDDPELLDLLKLTEDELANIE